MSAKKILQISFICYNIINLRLCENYNLYFTCQIEKKF